MPMLEVECLTVRYGRLEAVREASFQVDAGQIVALIGSNGAGKSSSLKAVIGLARAASGRIRLDGHDVTGMAPAARGCWPCRPRAGACLAACRCRTIC